MKKNPTKNRQKNKGKFKKKKKIGNQKRAKNGKN